MMVDRKHCPCCGSYNTKQIEVQSDYIDVIEEIRGCDECLSEYVVEFGDPRIKEIRDEQGEQIEVEP